VPGYIVEVYLPRSHADEAHAAGQRARVAVDEMTGEGASISYVRTTFLPYDETCFHLFEASSAEAVEEVSRRAALGRGRVIAVIDASDPNGESRT
jgi:hypothetical protein